MRDECNKKYFPESFTNDVYREFQDNLAMLQISKNFTQLQTSYVIDYLVLL